MSQTPNATNAGLEKLSQSRLALGDAKQDVRNCKVVDRDGHEVGHVSDLFIDQDERRVRMLEVHAGGFLGFGDRPVEAIISVTESEVRVNQTRRRIVQSPIYDPALVERVPREYWEPFYGHYELSPYWASGYMYPEFPMSRAESLMHESSDYRGD
jgi:sporulation protein YlmC with PRC-barrel domain